VVLYVGKIPVLAEFSNPQDLLCTSQVICCQARRFLTFGRDALEPELWVVMVKTVVMPSATLAGAASMFIQKETQDKMTINRLGIYIWIK
jgi:hypothetical protein